MGGTQFVGATDHAAGYLVVADTAPAFLLKKRELLQKSLIIFSVLMIWLTRTNYSAIQLTHALGSIITWSSPLELKVLESKYNGNQRAQQSDATNSLKLRAEQAIIILGGGRRSGAIEYPQYQDQNIEARAMKESDMALFCFKQLVCLY